jgi:protein SCO1/2
MEKFLILTTALLVASGISCAAPETATFETLFETPDFSLQNCSGENLSRNGLLDHIWVVDFIFTRCGGPCPLMTQRMRSLQSSLMEEGLVDPPFSVRLVSISVDPSYDTPEVLHEYALNWGADLESWYFLTGPAENTLQLIREGFKIAADREGSGTEHGGMEMPDIVHSTNFLLVDQRGWVRKIYHLDEPNLKEQIIEGIRALQNLEQ